MAQRIELGRSLQEHLDAVVRELGAAGQGGHIAADITFLVDHCLALGRRAPRPQRITIRVADDLAAGEHLALAHGADAAKNLLIGQEVQRADLVLRAPTSPVGGRSREELTDAPRRAMAVIVAHVLDLPLMSAPEGGSVLR